MTDRPTQLGQPVRGFASPEEAVLERVRNPHPDALYLARFTAPALARLSELAAD